MAEDSHYDKDAADHAVCFIEKFCCHTKGRWDGEPFELIDWQERIIRDIFGTLKPNGYRQFNTAYIEIPKKQGKQLALDTPIPTPDGWSTMGELKVGDLVFDENGKPCHVVAKSAVDDTEQAYRLTFRDGSCIIAGENHLWDVEDIYFAKPKHRIYKTREIYERTRQNKDASDGAQRSVIRIPVAKPLDTDNKALAAEQPVYGALAGDDCPYKTEGANLAYFHYLENIEPLPYPVKMQCIQVDSTSHCYLAGKSMVPTHNSELAAAVALYLLCADFEPGAEVYGCAADRNQAQIVFDVALAMVKRCPHLEKKMNIKASQKEMEYLPTGGKYKALSADVANKHGFNIHGVVFDELHTQPNRKLFDVMTKGSGDARMQPLYFLITTAGDNPNSICYEQHQKAKDIIEGRKVDPTFYPVIYGADDGDDWTDPEVWKKANPSLGITVGIDKVEAACEQAKQNPAEENAFRQLRLNQWVKQAVRWMPMDKWDACKTEFDESDLEGRVCYGGLDLSSTTDLSSFCLVFPPEDDEGAYYILPYFWVPEETIDLRVKRDHVPYDLWMRQGFIQTTEGNVIHYGFIEKFIERLGERFNIREIAFDRWGATQCVQNLEGMGFTVVPMGQGFAAMSPPTKELMTLTLQKRIAHTGHPVLRWNMDNICIRTDPAGNIKADKSKSTEKIDGAIAMIMALDRAIRCGNDTSESVYDSRGLLLL